MIALLAYPMASWSAAEVLDAVIASGIIAFCNVVLGYFLLQYAIDKSNSVFMGVVFGGMGIRMALILVALTILLINDYHALALSLALMGFYVVYMIVELVYVTRELGTRPSRSKAKKRAHGTERTASSDPTLLNGLESNAGS